MLISDLEREYPWASHSFFLKMNGMQFIEQVLENLSGPILFLTGKSLHFFQLSTIAAALHT